MTKRWKLKTNSSNILLVLITLILVKAEWVESDGHDDGDGFLVPMNSIENISNHSDHSDHFSSEDTQKYVGNDEIADYFFHSSVNNNSFILEGINNCLNSFQLITCAKMLLLSRINDVLSIIEQPTVIEKEVNVLNGLLKFKFKNDTFSEEPNETDLSLDEEIGVKVKRIFQKRSLLVYLFPHIEIEIKPDFRSHGGDIICFNYTIRKGNTEKDYQNEGRGKKGKGGGMSMMMIVPPLIMLGLMPFTLASLKAMVMNAVMINMMALNGAIFMTIRNLVFGPRQGDNVKYVNYGYSKDRQTQSKRPVLIIHSPAAFVKQPPVHKKKVHGYHSSSYHFIPNYLPEGQTSDTGYYYKNEVVL